MQKKVLLIATVQSHIGQFHKPLMKLLKANGWEVHVAARDNLSEKNGLTLEYPDQVFDIPFQRSPVSPKNTAAYRQLKQLLREEHYDIIHCNTPVGGVLGRLAARPYRRAGTKVFYTAHGFHFYKGASKKNWLVYYPIERLLAKNTDKVLTINTEDYEFAAKRFPCEVCHIHGVGVDERRYHPVSPEESLASRAALGYSASQKIILCIGELLPNKNQLMAIRMMTRLIEAFPDALLLIAGNGPERDRLMAKAEELRVSENVRFLGYVTNLQDYQHIADACVSCSYREGLGLNVIEAMLSGVPVVATDNRGHRDLIRDGVNGYLVPTDDDRALAARLTSVFAGDQTLRQEAYELAQKYGAGNVQAELAEIYGL